MTYRVDTPFMRTRPCIRFGCAMLAFMMAIVLANFALGQSRVPSPIHTTTTPVADAPAPEEPPPDPSAPTYTINLHPPNKVGQKFSLVADSSSKKHGHLQVVVMGIPTLGPSFDQDTIVHLEAEGEILAIFPNGSIKKVALTVRSLTATKDGKPAANVPATGAKIVAEALTKAQIDAAGVSPAATSSSNDSDEKISEDEKTKNAVNQPPRRKPSNTKITVDDKSVSDELGQLLNQVIDLRIGIMTNNEKLEPHGPIAVGTKWPIDLDPILENLINNQGIAPSDSGEGKSASKQDNSSNAQISVNAKSSGSFRLDGVQGSGDDQVVTVTGKFSIAANAPADALDCSLVMETHNAIPAVRSKGQEKQDSTGTMQFQVLLSKIGLGIKASGTDEMKDTSTVTYHE